MTIADQILTPEIKALVETLKNPEGTIIDFARKLVIPIADASKILIEPAKNEKLSKFFIERKWPINISSGYIYKGAGDIHSPYLERSGMLIKGQHVLAEKIPKKYKGQKNQYYNIYTVKTVIARKYLRGKIVFQRIADKKKFFKPYQDTDGTFEYWFIENSRELNDMIYEIEQREDLILHPTNAIKTTLVKHQWAGEVSEHDIISVRYDWR